MRTHFLHDADSPSHKLAAGLRNSGSVGLPMFTDDVLLSQSKHYFRFEALKTGEYYVPRILVCSCIPHWKFGIQRKLIQTCDNFILFVNLIIEVALKLENNCFFLYEVLYLFMKRYISSLHVLVCQCQHNLELYFFLIWWYK